MALSRNPARPYYEPPITGPGTTGPGELELGGVHPTKEQIQAVINEFAAPELDALRGASVIDQASRAAASRRALIELGYVPDFQAIQAQHQGLNLGTLGADIDPVTRQLAAKNTASGASAKAQLDKQRATDQRRIRKDLAGRGLLRSGELRYQAGEATQAANLREQKAIQQVLEYLVGYQIAFLQGERQREFQKAQALRSARDAALQDPRTASKQGRNIPQIAGGVYFDPESAGGVEDEFGEVSPGNVYDASGRLIPRPDWMWAPWEGGFGHVT